MQHSVTSCRPLSWLPHSRHKINSLGFPLTLLSTRQSHFVPSVIPQSRCPCCFLLLAALFTVKIKLFLHVVIWAAALTAAASGVASSGITFSQVACLFIEFAVFLLSCLPVNRESRSTAWSFIARSSVSHSALSTLCRFCSAQPSMLSTGNATLAHKSVVCHCYLFMQIAVFFMQLFRIKYMHVYLTSFMQRGKTLQLQSSTQPQFLQFLHNKALSHELLLPTELERKI